MKRQAFHSFWLVLAVGLSAWQAGPEVPAQPAGKGSEPRPTFRNPLDVAVDEHGRTARVVLTGTRTLAVVELATGKIAEETPWPEEKRLPEPSDVPIHAPDEATAARIREHLAQLSPERRREIRAIAWTGRGELLLAQVQARSSLPATQISQGWVFQNSLGIEPFAAQGERDQRGTSGTLILDDARRAHAEPADVVVGPGHERVFVAAAGADVVLVYDLGGVKNTVSKYADYASLSEGPRHLLARLPPQANPRRLGLSGDGKTLVVSNYLGESLTVIDAELLKVVRHIPLGGPEPDAARRGEMLFNSGRLTQFGQFSCASCHPNGGSDGLNWDLPRDGVGNFKNTKSLLGVKDTAPYGWLGTSPTLADRVAGTLRTLHKYEPGDEEVKDIVAYLETLPPPSPPARSGLTAESLKASERGRELFKGKARCAGCHGGPAFDDGKLHDVGTGTISGEERINTPSLRGLSSSSPYLHDGRAKSIEEVFSKYNERRKHGDADQLTAEELADLVAYLRSL
jgi:cytochrome c peroxidase